MPVSISYSDLRMITFSILYAPTLTFPLLALIINILYEGHDEIFKEWFGYAGNFDAQPFCGKPLPRFNYPDEAQIAIMCSDKRYKVLLLSLILLKVMLMPRASSMKQSQTLRQGSRKCQTYHLGLTFG
jgi:hypothetical protein